MIEPINNFKRADKFVIYSGLDCYRDGEFVGHQGLTSLILNDSESWNQIYEDACDTLIKNGFANYKIKMKKTMTIFDIKKGCGI